MPHFFVEYSRNVEPRLEIPILFDKLNAVAAETGVFPLGGIRTRAVPRDDYRIADGDPSNGFVHVTVRVGAGRSVETLHAAAERVYTVIADHLQPLSDETPFALSLEVQEIHPKLTFKKNNIHEYIKERRAKEA